MGLKIKKKVQSIKFCKIETGSMKLRDTMNEKQERLT